jgi:hypothetical protein
MPVPRPDAVQEGPFSSANLLSLTKVAVFEAANKDGPARPGTGSNHSASPCGNSELRTGLHVGQGSRR